MKTKPEKPADRPTLAELQQTWAEENQARVDYYAALQANQTNSECELILERWLDCRSERIRLQLARLS